jgi:AcrR family transcriptional regulator
MPFPSHRPLRHVMLPMEQVSVESQRRRRRIPTQERSRRLAQAVREAGVLILKEEGAHALTTTRIAERAGVSVGSLYQYFENRDAVLHAIYDEKTTRDIEAARRWVEHLRSLSPRERAAESIRWAFDQHRQRLELDPDFYREHHRDFSISATLLSDEREHGTPTALTYKLLTEAANELRSVDLDHASVLLSLGIPAMLRGVLDQRPDLLEDDTFRESLVDFVCVWLFGEREEGSKSTAGKA